MITGFPWSSFPLVISILNMRDCSIQLPLLCCIIGCIGFLGSSHIGYSFLNYTHCSLDASWVDERTHYTPSGYFLSGSFRHFKTNPGLRGLPYLYFFVPVTYGTWYADL
uniref:Uncharacterized protein n=1 Tax=Circoviridae sp. TaxID=1954248 RepID=A0A345N0X3_9VIRU